MPDPLALSQTQTLKCAVSCLPSPKTATNSSTRQTWVPAWASLGGAEYAARLLLAAGLLGLLTAGYSLPAAADGPLRVHPQNPRYFADAKGRVVYLIGSHTWSDFEDLGETDPPPAFDFEAYLDFLERHHHNFVRLWRWELTKYSYGARVYYSAPHPWPRTGPGAALDGKPRFDLSRFEQPYFDRLRDRVASAAKRGIYVSIMLFEGHGLHASLPPWCWDGHPFNVSNNINGINGDPDGDGRGIETQTLQIPAVTKLQQAYVRKVMDTVNDLDNVLYEIANESGSYSTQWQYHLIRFIHDYEKTKPKQHPVGMTFQWSQHYRGANATLFESPADWVSPSADDGYRDDPPAADGAKVVIADTDHLWGEGGDHKWVWKSFLRGLNPIYMDRIAALTLHPQGDIPGADSVREAMGQTWMMARRMNVAQMVPRNDLASTRYCLAKPGEEYLVYLPDGGEVTVDVSATRGQLEVEWLNPQTGILSAHAPVPGGERRLFRAPFEGHAVLHLAAKGAGDR
jgi:hypothetical protein